MAAPNPPDDFRATWAYPAELLEGPDAIPAAAGWVVHNTTRKFRSGRPVIEFAFYDKNREEVTRRDGMRLHSTRTGRDYEVVRRRPQPLFPRSESTACRGRNNPPPHMQHGVLVPEYEDSRIIYDSP